MCENFVREARTGERKATLNDVYQAAGPGPLVQMMDKNMDVADLGPEIQKLKETMYVFLTQ